MKLDSEIKRSASHTSPFTSYMIGMQLLMQGVTICSRLFCISRRMNRYFLSYLGRTKEQNWNSYIRLINTSAPWKHLFTL